MKIKKIETAFSDDRGTISDIFYKVDINHVAVIKTHNKGRIIRGNHYHKLTTQHIYMTKGSLRYWYKKYGEDVPVKVIDVPEGYMVSTEPYEFMLLSIWRKVNLLFFLLD